MHYKYGTVFSVFWCIWGYKVYSPGVRWCGPEALVYDSDYQSRAFYLQQHRHLMLTFLHPFSHQEEMEGCILLWELLSSTTMWVIWKYRCVKVFDNKTTAPVEAIKEIWSIIIHTLKGQYDNIKGHSEAAEKQRRNFHDLWRHGPFYSLDAS